MSIVRICLAFFINVLFYASEAGYVDKLIKCSIREDNCLKSFRENIILEYGKHGFPELNLPPSEPMVFKNISVPILESFTFNLVNGFVKGMSNCTYHNFHVDMAKKRETLAVTCDLTIEGKMGVTGNGESIKAIFGKPTVVSHGQGKLSFEKIYIVSYTNFKLFKKDDGQVYWVYDTEDAKYSYDVPKVSFNANNFFVEKTDISKILVEYFKSNWKAIVDNIGDQFLSQSMDRYFANLSKLFSSVPISAYIIEDLSLNL